MTGSILGERFVVVSFGESHGPAIGAVVDGCPAGLPLAREDIQREVDLRKPADPTASTARAEGDEVKLLSGVYRGYTTGAPIAMLVENRDVDSSWYLANAMKPRPGHADYPAWVKYRGFNDPRGGGRFSGRITVGFVMAGAVAKKLLSYTLGAEILAYTAQVGRVKAEPPAVGLRELRRIVYSNSMRAPDSRAAREMRRLVAEARAGGDSIGSVVECVVEGLPPGLGEPVFSSLESDLSKALFSIPGVKGVEFGAGFKLAEMHGSESNDQYTIRGGRVVTVTNNCGGVLGGLSTGGLVVFRAVLKPPSSIAKPQMTVDLKSMSTAEIKVAGRHDACLAPRAAPVVEAVTAIVLADHAIRAGLIPPVLGEAYARAQK